MSIPRLRILVIAPELPKPDAHAGYSRFVALLEMLARVHQVDLYVPYNESNLPHEDRARYASALERIGVCLLPSGWENCAAALAKNYYDAAWFEFYHLAQDLGGRIRRRQPGAKVIVDSVDVHFVRETAAEQLGVVNNGKAAANKLRELAVYRAADAVIAVSDLDAAALSREGGMPPLFVIPLVYPIRARAIDARLREVLFVGGFRHLPNVDGIHWFVDNVWPRIVAAVPDARLKIVGSNAPPEVFALDSVPGVDVIGYVPEVNPYLDRVTVSVAPLRFGSGMKGKVIEAMASGVPVVTTSVGIQGIEVVSGEHLLIADEAESFAHHVIAVLQNAQQGERLGLAGQKFAASLCSSEAIERALNRMLSTIIPRRRSRVMLLRWVSVNAAAGVRALSRQATTRIYNRASGTNRFSM